MHCKQCFTNIIDDMTTITWVTQLWYLIETCSFCEPIKDINNNDDDDYRKCKKCNYIYLHIVNRITLSK